MVSEDRIREEGMTTDDVLSREFAEPQEEVVIYPEWEEYPEERPGENLRIEDDELRWEREGFEFRLWSDGPTKWKAHISVPEPFGETYARAVDVKCLEVPKYGFVESVEIEDYKLREVTLVLSENFQPTTEVNVFADHLVESYEGYQTFQDDLERKLEAARENEE